MCKDFPNDHTILRIGNIIGPGMKPHTFIGQAIRTLAAQKQIILDVNGNTPRDFLPVTDFATALIRIINTLPKGTFNIGAGPRLAKLRNGWSQDMAKVRLSAAVIK